MNGAVTLRQLHAFLAVARLASFTRAAAALHTTQPALSLQVAQLEDSLQLRLFDRSTRSVTLTRVGRELLPRAERTLAELAGVFEAAQGLSAGVTGRVVVAALPSVASTLLPRALAQFARSHPGISVTLRDAVGGRIGDWVRSGEADLGVTAEALDDTALTFSVIAADEIVAVVPPRHALARTKRLTLEALLAHPLILMSRDSSVRRVVDAAFADAGHLAAPVQEPVYMSTAVALVREGLGVALLPSSAAELRTATGLRTQRIAHRGMTRRIGIVARGGHTLSPAAAAFERTLWATAKEGR